MWILDVAYPSGPFRGNPWPMLVMAAVVIAVAVGVVVWTVRSNRRP